MQEKLLHLLGLPREHLVAQVIEHIAMAAAEGSEKCGDIGSALQRKRRQLQTCNPAFGVALESGDGRRLQVQPHHSLQKRAHFGASKA